jgi:hypothetical protein
MSTKIEQDFIKDKVRSLLGRGMTQRQIATELKCSLGKVNSLVQELKHEAKLNVQKYVNEELPSAYENTLNGLNQILVTTWNSIDEAHTDRDRYQGLALCMQAYSLRLELLSSAEPLRHVVSFVDSHNNKDSLVGGRQQNDDSIMIGKQTEEDSSDSNETTAEH